MVVDKALCERKKGGEGYKGYRIKIISKNVLILTVPSVQSPG